MVTFAFECPSSKKFSCGEFHFFPYFLFVSFFFFCLTSSQRDKKHRHDGLRAGVGTLRAQPCQCIFEGRRQFAQPKEDYGGAQGGVFEKVYSTHSPAHQNYDMLHWMNWHACYGSEAGEEEDDKETIGWFVVIVFYLQHMANF